MGLLVQLPNLAGARRPSPCGRRRGRGGARFSISAAATGGGVKEEEEEEEEEKGTRGKEGIVIRVSDPVRERRLPPPLFSSPDAPSSARRRKGEDDGEDRRRRYYVNVGDAIRTLREELPAAFYREPSFHIYRDDIAFKDPINNFMGIDNYKRIFWALRFTGQIFFKALWIDIVSIWQPVEDVIMIRWIVHGIPRVLSDGPGRFEGTSEYKFDKNGKIYEHKVDNVAKNTPTKFKVLPVVELIRSLGCPSTPKPTYFETSPLQLIWLLPFWFKLTWMRWYLSLYLILANLSKG